MPPAKRMDIEESEEELLQMTKAEASEGLTDKEQRFCEYYCRNLNIKIAAIKAGYGKESAHMVGYKLRRKQKVNRYICWLKLLATKEHCIKASDIIDKYVRIAFADMTDFVEVKNNRIKLVNGDELDGQLISKIKQGKDGVSIELYDKLRALEKLEKYFDVWPKDWKQAIEEKKLEIMREHLELEKIKAGQFEIKEGEDDGLLEALKGTATEVWEDGEDE